MAATSGFGGVRYRRRPALLGGTLLSLLPLPWAARAQTVAGVRITNVAAATYRQDGTARTTASNLVDDTVAERLDVTLAPTGDPAAAGEDVVFRARLVNAGNGHEAFDLSATANGAALRSIAIDGEGGTGAAAALVNGRTPELAPGAALSVLIALRPDPTPDPTGAASVTLTARAATGSGVAGTVFAGRGDGGGDAVVGPTTASATITIDLAASAAPTLSKRQAVLAPDGSTDAVPGATVTYTLEARFPAATPGARISDDLPAGLRFVPGSATLDGVSLPDAAALSGTTVAAALGDVAAGAVRTVQFKAIID